MEQKILNHIKNSIAPILFGLFLSTSAFAADGFETGGKNPDDDSVIYYFGYGSNLDESYFKQWTPSAKRVTLANFVNTPLILRAASAALFQSLAA